MSTSPSTHPVAFYSMADAAAFVGVVGLVNSLRFVGHDDPLVLLDCGLSDEQRAVLRPHVRFVEGPWACTRRCSSRGLHSSIPPT